MNTDQNAPKSALPYHVEIWLLRLAQLLVIIVAIGIFLGTKRALQHFFVNDCFAESLMHSVAQSNNESYEMSTLCQFIDGNTWINWAIIPLILLVTLHLTSLFLRLRRYIRRRQRALVAIRVLNNMQHMNFALYLRSFKKDKDMVVKKNFWWYLFARGGAFNSDFETVDALVTAEFAMRMPVLGLDKNNEGFGSGKLTTNDNDWWDLAKALMQHARLIIAAPGTSDGIIDELNHALENHSEKLVCFIPSENLFVSETETLQEYWQRLAERCQSQCKVELPDYDESGAIFCFDENKQRVKTLPFQAVVGKTNLRKSCEPILDELL